MKRYAQCLLVGLTVGAVVWLASDRGQAGGTKNEPWEPVLSRDVYKELVQREADRIQEILGAKEVDEKLLERAKFGAVLIAALAQSVKDGKADDVRGTFETAWLLHAALKKKDMGEAKKLAAALLTAKAAAGKATPVTAEQWGKALTKAELMDHFRPKAKGGDGMHPDLQNNIKFKGALNGVEEKIRYLSLKELTPAGMKKESKELELLGYRAAVVGALTYLYAPAKKEGNKDPEDWRRYSIATRDSGVTLAAAAAKGDAAALLKAGNALNSACSQCHAEFRLN
jgi:hypothetical protein